MPRKLDGTFIESGTITITQLSGSVNETSNAAYGQANLAYDQANTARSQANAAYGQANSARSDANTTFATVNTSFGTLNTTFGTVNTSLGTVNTAVTNAHNQANAAFNAANGKLSLTGGTIVGDITVTGNLFVNGTETIVNTSSLTINDPIFLLANNNTTNAVGIGFVGHYGPTQQHAGLIRAHQDNNWYLFENYDDHILYANNVLDVANVKLATLRANVNANSLLLVGNAVATQANLTLAHNQANSARSDANTTFGTVNTTFSTVNTTFGTVNTNIGLAYNQANAAYAAANTKLNSSSYTASDVLSKLLTVDGSGSSLDADLIDGYQGTSLVQRSNTSSQATLWDPYGNYYTSVWSVGNDYNNFVNAGSYHVDPNASNRPAATYGYLRVWRHVGANYNLQEFTPSSDSSTTYRRVGLDNGAGGYTWNGWSKYWSDGNDGSGSGLDADLWDGYQFADYLNQAVKTTSSPTFSVLAVSRAYAGTDTGDANSFQCSNWFRSTGASGWYNQSYGGGIYMTDTTWIRTYNSKNFYVGGGYIETNSSVRGPIFYDSDDTNAYFDGGGSLVMRGGSPTVYFRDTDHNSGMIHCNSNLLYILRGGNDTTSWSQVNGQWPFIFNLSNNDASCGAAFSAVGNITAYSSDRRLKENLRKIESAVDKVKSLNGYYFDWIDKVAELGFTPDRKENDIGLIAQEVEAVMPQAVAPAPFDKDPQQDGTYKSKSGENYITIDYDKLVPLLVEAIKEQNEKIEKLEALINERLK